MTETVYAQVAFRHMAEGAKVPRKTHSMRPVPRQRFKTIILRLRSSLSSQAGCLPAMK